MNSETSLANKVALITGGASGIGGGCALRLAKAGADIVIADIEPKLSEETAGKIRALGRKAFVVQTDAMATDQIKSAVEKGAAHFGRLDILVNNVGGVRRRDFVEMSDRNWQNHLNLNLMSTFMATQTAAKIMIDKKNGGAIVNISSTEGLRAAPGFAVYSACKAAMIQFTRTMALELAGHNIRVNCIAPDMIKTPGLEGLDPPDPKLEKVRMRYVPLARWATPEECANVVLFLCSPMSSFVTGVTIPVDGGITASAGWTRSPTGSGEWNVFHAE